MMFGVDPSADRSRTRLRVIRSRTARKEFPMKMKPLLLAAVLLLTAMAIGFGSVGADESATVAEPQARTLNGEFAWSDRSTGPLEAVFEPAGDDTWNVSFFFEFRGKPHTYTGTATGNLESGTLEGRVQNEDKRRTWEFSGDFEGGTYNGEHWEIFGDDRSLTGTLTLNG